MTFFPFFLPTIKLLLRIARILLKIQHNLNVNTFSTLLCHNLNANWLLKCQSLLDNIQLQNTNKRCLKVSYIQLINTSVNMVKAPIPLQAQDVKPL